MATIINNFISAGVEVYGDVAIKTVSREDQSQKKNAAGLPGWVVSVLVQEGRLINQYNVTVWSAKRPAVADTDVIVFTDLSVGAYVTNGQGNLYFHASGCTPSLAAFED